MMDRNTMQRNSDATPVVDLLPNIVSRRAREKKMISRFRSFIAKRAKSTTTIVKRNTPS
ncbi:hypothetical protein Lalb_Chr22g0357261 [Lupinus albus]|uniref:Uncharacterized protein n=1 Tax=Lupinus albus TaxID=3870 RepID=A0A6A4NIG6_LUPAL|nr:hypothetical protein Lalb_Chr22g0357261 [Lupinus albus]